MTARGRRIPATGWANSSRTCGPPPPRATTCRSSSSASPPWPAGSRSPESGSRRRTTHVCDAEQGFGIHVLHEEPDHRLLVFAAAWLPGRGPTPHDHGTWAVVAGVDGAETNISWERLDDGSRPGYASLRKREERIVEPGDVLTFLPGAIHSVVNHTREVTVSLHVYGFNINLTQRAQFNVEQGLERPITLRMTPAH